MAVFEFVWLCKPMQEFRQIMAKLRVLFLAPALGIPSGSLRGIGFFHGTPRCVAENVVVKVVFHCGFRLLLKNVEADMKQLEIVSVETNWKWQSNVLVLAERM